MWLGKSHSPRTDYGESSRRSSFSPQLLLVEQLILVVHSGIVTSDSVLSKTAIFPQKEVRKREISNESARGSSLRDTNV